MSDKSHAEKFSAITEAIYSLAREMRLLSFGNADVHELNHGAIERLDLTATESSDKIVTAINGVSDSLSEIAEAINRLSETLENRDK
jgi:hypothetical protein